MITQLIDHRNCNNSWSRFLESINEAVQWQLTWISFSKSNGVLPRQPMSTGTSLGTNLGHPWRLGLSTPGMPTDSAAETSICVFSQVFPQQCIMIYQTHIIYNHSLLISSWFIFADFGSFVSRWRAWGLWDLFSGRSLCQSQFTWISGSWKS